MQVIVTDRFNDLTEYEVSDLPDLFTQLSDDMKIDALCGGCCSCATCHIYTEESDAEYFSECEPAERDVLDGLLYARNGSRLLCQLSLKEKLGSLKITIAQAE
ncbi:2Fe-2S iron-sulfur cluster-binding protein [uncultured Zhongshania sp.]|uniref:2Fe-2S iron-sulfur cluster-binding protein n=1 Tax=uncultured Zhongshania sp. TaxID=1642288 RepID=UPI0025F6DAFA|nr:2Fe-2S iron-sulfur cluster-binding protein [uncultured Zhongshania sp.]